MKERKNLSFVKKMKVCFCCDQIISCGGLIVPMQYVARLNKLGYEAYMIANGHNSDLESFYGVQAKPMRFLNEWTDDDVIIAVWWPMCDELEKFKGRKIQFVQGQDLLSYVGDDVKAKCIQTRQRPNWEIMAVSKYAGEWTGRSFTIIPNGVDERFKSKNKDRDISILMEGNSEPNKGIDEMIKICQQFTDNKCGWLGRSTVGAFNGTKFENVPQKDIPNVYSRAKILLKLSKSEGFSMPIIEGMASGCAIITQDMGGNDFCKFGENCEKVDKIKEVLENESLRSHLVENGYKTAEDYSLDNSVKKLIEYLKI